MRFHICALLALSTIAGCDPSETEREIDYSQEGPDGPNAQTEFSRTASGLQYRILREGTGKKPTASDRVVVSYRGWLDDGSVFYSSYERGKPSDYPYSQLVAGMKEGLQLIVEGGKIELSIPPELGYGASGKPPAIPPNAQLHFIIELHEVQTRLSQ